MIPAAVGSAINRMHTHHIPHRAPERAPVKYIIQEPADLPMEPAVANRHFLLTPAAFPLSSLLCPGVLF